jgi:hypothetical protein
VGINKDSLLNLIGRNLKNLRADFPVLPIVKYTMESAPALSQKEISAAFQLRDSAWVTAEAMQKIRADSAKSGSAPSLPFGYQTFQPPAPSF